MGRGTHNHQHNAHNQRWRGLQAQISEEWCTLNSPGGMIGKALRTPLVTLFLFVLCVCVCVRVHALCNFSPVQLFVTLWTVCSPPGSSVLGISPSMHISVSCHALLQGICLTYGLNLHLLHCRQILYPLSHL